MNRSPASSAIRAAWPLGSSHSLEWGHARKMYASNGAAAGGRGDDLPSLQFLGRPAGELDLA